MNNMDTSSPPVRTCTTCQKPEIGLPQLLKHCSKCTTILYCSPRCQKIDWKNHKRICTSPGPADHNKASPPLSGQHNPGFHLMNEIFGLSNNEHLHKLTREQAFEQLIDCFRLRMRDEHVFAENSMGTYAGEDPQLEFKRFLDLADTRAGLLPPWWNAAKRRECTRIAMDRGGRSNINCAVEKSDIMEHYGDTTMPLKLRVLGEKIYGRGFMLYGL